MFELDHLRWAFRYSERYYLFFFQLRITVFLNMPQVHKSDTKSINLLLLIFYFQLMQSYVKGWFIIIVKKFDVKFIGPQELWKSHRPEPSLFEREICIPVHSFSFLFLTYSFKFDSYTLWTRALSAVKIKNLRIFIASSEEDEENIINLRKSLYDVEMDSTSKNAYIKQLKEKLTISLT